MVARRLRSPRVCLGTCARLPVQRSPRAGADLLEAARATCGNAEIRNGIVELARRSALEATDQHLVPVDDVFSSSVSFLGPPVGGISSAVGTVGLAAFRGRRREQSRSPMPRKGSDV